MSDRARNLIEALGGKENIRELESCITRLRLDLVDPSRINEKLIKAQGAVAVIKMGKSIQVIIGTQAVHVETEMKALLK